MVAKSKKDFRRWEYDDDETETNMEETLSLDGEGDTGEEMLVSNSTTTFVQPNNTSNGNGMAAATQKHAFYKKRLASPARRKRIHTLVLSLGLFLGGFIPGIFIGLRNQSVSPQITSTRSTSSAGGQEESSANPAWAAATHDINEAVFRRLVTQIKGGNIRHNLKRMSQEVHGAGTAEGRSMAIAIRDLWRTYGLSVRVEQHKTLLTKTEKYNFLEVFDGNGSAVSFRTSLVGDDVNLPNARPLIAFSPPANLNGTLVYGHYGSSRDFQLLEKYGIPLNGSIALVRFGALHPSKVAGAAVSFGLSGVVFYPDPVDFGPLLPGVAVRRASLLTLSQIHEYQKHKSRLTLPCHTISFNDAENLLRLMETAKKSPVGPPEWIGGLFDRDRPYPLGGRVQARLRLFNEVKTGNIYNVVAAIPGAWESDRYVIVGCSHDSWTYGAGDPGVGLAVMTEITRAFASSVQGGWRPRRSILFISWDANLQAHSGVSHWLQEHHFEIWTRAVAYLDLSRILEGNQTLRVFSSPLLREVARKAIQRVRHLDSITFPETGGGSGKSRGGSSSGPGIVFSSTITSHEPAFAFFGNLGIPFLRLTVSNNPKGWDYPLFHTAFDTFDNFANLVDPTFTGAESLGRIISGLMLLLADSSLLPLNVEDYVEEIQKAFGNFMAHYQEDLHRANLSIAYLQAAVMRLEVIGDNFRTDIHNRSVVNNEPLPSSSHAIKNRKLLFYRIINDKLMELDRAFLSRKSEIYKHQVVGFNSCSWLPGQVGTSDGDEACNSTEHASFPAFRYNFPRLREILECGRESRRSSRAAKENASNCPLTDWRNEAAQEIASLIRSLDAAAATLQSPLLPEESDTAN